MKVIVRRTIVLDLTFILYFTYIAWRSVLRFIVSSKFADISIFSIMCFAFAISLIVAFRSQRMWDVLVLYLIVITLFVITYFFNTNVQYCYWDENWGISRMLQFGTGGIWAYLAIRLIPDKDRLLSDLKIVAYITFIYNLLILLRMFRDGAWLIANNQGVISTYEYNQEFGYDMIFVAVVFLLLWSIRKKWTDFLIMLVAIACAFIWGSRGSLLCLVAAIILLILTKWKELNSDKKLFVFLLIVVAAILIYIFSGAIFNALNNILDGLGFSSRSLESLISGTFTQDPARLRIWSLVFERIKIIFPFGLGAFGDRPIVMPYYAWGYSHNIILEMTISFGILGLVFLAWLVYRSFKIILNKGVCYIIVIIMLSMSAKLLVSDSFWFYWAFWGLLAICVTNRKLMKSVAIE